MASPFGKYTGGIQPVQGLFEMGASIGKNYAAGITQVADNLTKGVEDYMKVKRESEYADTEFDAEGKKYTVLAEMLKSEPETAHLVEGITPILDTIAKGRKGSHSAKLAALSQVKAQGKALSETFQYMGLVRGAKERRLFDEANTLPPEGEEVTTKSFGLNTKDTQWSPNLSYTANVERVKGNYRKWLDSHKDELASGKFRVMSEDDFIKDWKRRLPNAIQNSGLATQDKAWAMDIIQQNELLEGMSDEDMGAQGFFMQDWATINSPSSQGGSKISTATAPAGTIAQEPASSARQFHPNAIKLQDENERLIVEANKLKAKIGTSWFGGDDPARARLAEITKQIGDNNLIINSLGGAPSSSQINRSNANRTAPLAKVTFGEEESPVLAPDKVEEPIVSAPVVPVPVPSSSAPVARTTEPTEEYDPTRSSIWNLPEWAGGKPERKSQPNKATASPAKVAEPQAEAQAPQGLPEPEAQPKAAAPQKDAGKPPARNMTRILANEKLAIENYNKKKVAEWKAAEDKTKELTLGAVEGDIGNVMIKYGMTQQEFKKLNPHIKHADTYFNFEKGGRRKFNQKFADVKINVPERAGKPATVTDLTQLPQEVLVRLKQQNGGYLSIEQGKNAGLEAGGSADYAADEGGAAIDTAGNVTITEDINALKNRLPDEEQSAEGDGIDTGQFTPIKLKPITGTRPTTGSSLPSLPAGVKASYTPEQTEDIKIAARHVQETTAEVQSQQRSVDPAIKYLEAIKDNVINGDGTAVDYGSYGKWEKLHPDAASAINTAAQAGALWYGGGWGKTVKFANSIEKVDFVTRKSKIARETATKFIEAIRKTGRIETPEEVAKAVSLGMKQAGLANKQLSKELLYEGVGRIGGSITKSATWSAIINQMVGDEPYSVGDDVNNSTIKNELASVLEEVRKARQDEGGYSAVPFNSKPITAAEIVKIRTILDNKIATLRNISQQNVAQLESIKTNSTPDNLLRLAEELKTNSKAQLAAVEVAKASGLYEDPSAGIPTDGYGEIEIGGQSVASKDFVIPQSNESRKKQMMEYMKGRLGYVPAGFDDMWRKTHPESTLQIKETPYGVFFTDGKGEWKQMSSSGGKQLQPHEVAANRAVQFGALQPDGTYLPTEFIAGSGIKLGGIGTFGTPSDATKFRMEYTRKIKALRYADELRQMNEVTFRSMMPSQWGKAKAKVASLVAQMRQELIGVGSVSDFEQKLLKDLVADPTDFFRLQSTVRSTYEELIDKLARSLVEDPQTYGIEVQMPRDKQAQLKNMRAVYLAQQERYKKKMSDFQNQESK
jgi:hypothetical protein